jgi:PWWP domain
VHWDPNSPDGKLIGRMVRIGILRRNLQKCNLVDDGDSDDDEDDDDDDDDDPYQNQFWMEGRIVLYDPYTHKHKIEWKIPEIESTTTSRGATTASTTPEVHVTKRGRPPKKKQQSPSSTRSSTCITSYNRTTNSTTWIWLRNEQHNLHVATRLVWAYVRGFAWWPAVVMECNTPLESSSSSSNNNNICEGSGGCFHLSNDYYTNGKVQAWSSSQKQGKISCSSQQQ